MKWMVAVWLATSVMYMALAAGAAALLAAFADSALAQDILATLPVDRVHAAVALEMAGSAQAPRLTVPLLRDVASAWWPAVFSGEPGRTGLVGLLFAASTSPVAVWAAHAVASAALLSLGTLAVHVARRAGRRWVRCFPGGRRVLAVAGRVAQGLALGVQVDLLLSDQRAASMVAPMVATKLLGAGESVAELPLGLVLALPLHALVLLSGWALGWCLVRAVQWAARRHGVAWRGGGPARTARHPWAWRGRRAAPIVIAALLAASPVGLYVGIDSRGDVDAGQRPAVATPPRQPLRGSVVDIVQVRDEYLLLVDGRRRVLRGAGYNCPSLRLPPEQRRQRLQQDFAYMRSNGFNAVLGWSEREFDAELLAAAAEAGLGVIVPFHLDPSWDYGSPEVRRALLNRISGWVELHKRSPALWMWGLGNEVVHGIDDTNGPRAAAFAEFLMDAAEHIRQLDPYHPVVYRDAEDVYVQPVAAALAKRPRRTWFVYGMNFFTPRIADALANGPTSKLNQPLLISEFGPAGATAAGRPTAYLQQWRVIRSHRQRVLGGFVYVWCQQGPEPLDRVFGLTDAYGRPADGSLAALAMAFSEEAAASPGGADAPPLIH